MGTFSLFASLALGAALAFAPPPPGPGDERPAVADEEVADDVETAELRFRAHRSWDLRLPNERWRSAAGGIEIDGFEFAVERTGEARIDVDTTGDGRLDSVVRGLGGFLPLRVRQPAGETFEYAVRLRNEGRSWSWSTSGMLTGRVRGETVHLIDQNGNGRYDDFGEDAMVVGRRLEAAFLLSSIVNLGGELFHFEVDGTTVTTRPYRGETARIEVESDWEGRGKLVSAVFADPRSSVSFDPVGSRGGLLVPAGTYRFVSGMAAGQGESVQMRSGSMLPIELEANEERSLRWGGPVSMVFDYDMRGEEITVGADLRFFGDAGEEYHTFQPDAKSPKILIYDKKTGKMVRSGRFGGC